MSLVADGADPWSRAREAIDFVLISPSHPGNVGSAARAIKVMGFERLTLVAPRHANAADHPEAMAFASGAQDVLERCKIVPTLEQAVSDASLTVAVSAAGREFAPVPQTPSQIVERVLGHPELGPVGPDVGAPVAFVFGTERNGLSIEQAQQCQVLCQIPSNPRYGSLNLSQAIQVIAYELRQGLLAQQVMPVVAKKSLHRRDMPAQHQQLEGMFNHLEQSLVTLGFLDPDEPKRLMPRLRHLLTRAEPTGTEVDILRGICAAIDRQMDDKTNTTDRQTDHKKT